MTENLSIPGSKIHPANPRLWAVKCYLDLISKDGQLVYGPGIRRLYTLSSGMDTLIEDHIVEATDKAIKMGLIPHSLHSFMVASILKNCYLYGVMLQEMITDRIISIANGDVQNPEPQVSGNPVRVRREFYLPPGTFVSRLQTALRDDFGSVYGDSVGPVRINDVAHDTNILLARFDGNDGRNMPYEAVYGALGKAVGDLVELLKRESTYVNEHSDYRIRAKGALKILWFIAKLLMGDLSQRPNREDLTLVDLDKRWNMSDGTLAAIPFPIQQSVALFEDTDPPVGISMKARTYLAAVAAATFDRRDNSDEG